MFRFKYSKSSGVPFRNPNHLVHSYDQKHNSKDFCPKGMIFYINSCFKKSTYGLNNYFFLQNFAQLYCLMRKIKEHTSFKRKSFFPFFLAPKKGNLPRKHNL